MADEKQIESTSTNTIDADCVSEDTDADMERVTSEIANETDTEVTDQGESGKAIATPPMMKTEARQTPPLVFLSCPEETLRRRVSAIRIHPESQSKGVVLGT